MWPALRIADRQWAQLGDAFTMTLDQIEVANLALDAIDTAQADADPGGAP